MTLIQQLHSVTRSGPASVHQLLLRPESLRPTLGPQCFFLHGRGQCYPARGAGKQEQGVELTVTPQGTGLPPTGPSDFVQPEASSAYVCRVRVHASERELFGKHAFWHKTRDIAHFIGCEALL